MRHYDPRTGARLYRYGIYRRTIAGLLVLEELYYDRILTEEEYEQVQTRWRTLFLTEP
jgi:hypothetical protein